MAEYKGKLSFTKYPIIVFAILEMYPNCLIIPEYNTIGQAVCDALNDSNKWKDHVYRAPKYSKNGQIIYKYGGVYTDSVVRPKIVDAIFNNATKFPNIVLSSRLKLELAGFRDRSESRSKKNTSTDDLAMAWGFALYLLDHRLYNEIPYYKKQIMSISTKTDINTHLIKTFIDETYFDINEKYFGKNYLNHYKKGVS